MMWFYLIGIVAVIMIIVVFWNYLRRPPQGETPEYTSPMEMLDQRYAAGEITRDEYETLRKDIEETRE